MQPPVKRRKLPFILCSIVSTILIFWIACLVALFYEDIFTSTESDQSDSQTKSSFPSTTSGTPPNLLSIHAILDGRLHLHLQTPQTGCPAPNQALIGILTTATPLNTNRRTHLRTLYTNHENTSIDITYFFGLPQTNTEATLLQTEQSTHPSNTISTTRPENRDTGKILDWFEYARNNSYTPHPTIHGAWCRKYRFIGKADDDGIMHLSRLESFLESISEGSKFIGRPFVDVIGDAKIKVYGMHGMLYLMSLDLVEWIAHSPIPRENLIGIEDQQVGYWLQKSNIAMEREIMPAAQLHDRADAPGHKHWQHAITKETIVVHRCKEIPIFLRCLSNLFSDDTKKLKSTDRLLKQPQAAITHASESLGLLFTPNQMKQTLRAIKQTLIQNPRLMTIREYNSLLTQEFQKLRLTSMGFNMTGVDVSEMEAGKVDVNPQFTHTDIWVKWMLLRRVKTLGLGMKDWMVEQLVEVVKSPSRVVDLSGKRRRKKEMNMVDVIPKSGRKEEELDLLIIRFAVIKMGGERLGLTMDDTEVETHVTKIKNVLMNNSGTTAILNKELDFMLVESALELRLSVFEHGFKISASEIQHAAEDLVKLLKSNKYLSKDEISSMAVKLVLQNTLNRLGLKRTESRMKELVPKILILKTKRYTGMLKAIVRHRISELNLPTLSEVKLNDVVEALKPVLKEGKSFQVKEFNDLIAKIGK